MNALDLRLSHLFVHIYQMLFWRWQTYLEVALLLANHRFLVEPCHCQYRWYGHSDHQIDCYQNQFDHPHQYLMR